MRIILVLLCIVVFATSNVSAYGYGCKRVGSCRAYNTGNGGCNLDFSWIDCRDIGHTHLRTCRSGDYGGCRTNCICSCDAGGYTVSWYDQCQDMYVSDSFYCTGCRGWRDW